MSGAAIGIDLGTTNSVAAISVNGQPRVLSGADGTALVPSFVSFPTELSVVVGREARERRIVDPENTVFSIKRLLGRSVHSEEVRMSSARLPVALKEGPGEAVLVHTRGGELALPEISAHVLRSVRSMAEAALGDRVTRAVITVPANFNELQRTATKLSGQIADLDVLRILNEPTAAALAYGYGRGTREKIAVYDYGGGTFDVTLLELAGNVFEVLATAGDTFLGGDDIDLSITERLADEVERTTRINPRADRRIYERLREASEQAKMELAVREHAQISLNDIGKSAAGRAVHFSTRLTRRELDAIAEPWVERTLEVCSEALKLAGLTADEFPSVILVGGSSRMLLARQRVTEFFGKAPLMTLPPEHVVAMGAAILAEALSGGARKMRAPSTATLDVQSTAGTSRPRSTGTEHSNASIVPDGLLEGSFANRLPSAASGLGIPRGRAVGGSKRPTNPGSGDDIEMVVPRAGQRVTSPGMLNPNLPGADLGSLDEPMYDPSLRTSSPPGAAHSADPGGSHDDFFGPPGAPMSAMGATDNITIISTVSQLATLPGAPLQPGVQPLGGAGRPPRGGSQAAMPAQRGSSSGIPVQRPSGSMAATSAPGVFETTMIAGSGTPSSGSLRPQSMPLPRRPTPPAGIAMPTLPQGLSRDELNTQIARAPGMPAGAVSHGFDPQRNAAFPSGHQQGHPASPPAGNYGTPPSSASTQPPQTPAARSPFATTLPGVSTPPMVAPAAVQHPVSAASVTTNSPPLLIDVTPHSLGIETLGGVCEVIIPRNATIPVEQTRQFTTIHDNQDVVTLRIAQGESRKFVENQRLGELELSGIPRALRGEVTVSVTFELDANGTLSVKAREVGTGRQTQTRITLLATAASAQG